MVVVPILRSVEWGTYGLTEGSRQERFEDFAKYPLANNVAPHCGHQPHCTNLPGQGYLSSKGLFTAGGDTVNNTYRLSEKGRTHHFRPYS